ncbi:MAG: hypothetical protein QY330_00615 [Candidatus Dojkabacteria bacterium]|nr:MAG: hypothetical protein QY330_00615 [Candidatus Dojkabacteria bacterium]
MFQTKLKAFSILEIVIVVGLAALIFTSVYIFSIDAEVFADTNRTQANAAAIMQEEMQALLINKQSLWKSIVDNTENGDLHLAYTNETYQINSGKKVNGDYEISFTIDRLFRDTDGYVAYGYNLQEDINGRIINFTITWQDVFSQTVESKNVMYLTNWNTPIWTETTTADFNDGTTTDTIVASTGGGAIELDLDDEIEPDWCLPTITATSYNLIRQGNPTAISAIPNKAFMTTGGNASGPGLDSVAISSDNPPIITQLATSSALSKVNDVFVDSEGNYVYVTSDDNGNEVGIFDVSTQNYQLVGYFNASGSTDGIAVWAQGNVGYMTQGQVFRTFDLSSKTGSRSQLGSVTLARTGSDIVVRGNYAYVAITGSSIEMQIIDVSNPSNPQIVGFADVNGQGANAVYVSADGNRAYLGTSHSSSQDEFFIINTSSKNGSRPVIRSYNSNGTTIRDLTVIEEDQRAVLVGQNGEEYQVLDISDENNIIRCGGMQYNQGLLGVEGVIDANGYIWSYVLTNNSSAELMVILGGEFGGGGGGGQGSQYVSYGEYVSSVFDTGSSSTYYYSLNWSETLNENTDIVFQVRSGTSSNLSSVAFVGPDGTSSTFFTNYNGEYLPQIIQNKRYVQYKAILTSDRIFTPILESVRINYEP